MINEAEKNSQTPSQYNPSARLLKDLEQMELKVKKSNYEKKEVLKEVSSLKQQNEFLLSQLNYTQRKAKLVKDDGFDPYQQLQEVCSILGIQDESNLRESLLKIKKVFDSVPQLQELVERIFQIATEDSCIPVRCDSKEQLIEIIENWAANLKDYQSLVLSLFEILGIEDDTMKNRTFLLESIKELVNIQCEEEQENGAQEQIQELQKKQSNFRFFCEEAKKRLKIKDYSDEALFEKIFQVIDKTRESELVEQMNREILI